MLKHKFLVFVFLAASCMAATAQFDTGYWYGFSVDNPPAPPDHSDWQQFIDRYRLESGRIDYAAITAGDRQMLTGYVQYLQDIDPRYHSYDHQLAYWLNLHNATVVILVLESGATHLDDLGSNYAHRRDPLIEVASVELSLDDIVEGILLPIWQQPEVHFLVACAAMHCPAVPAEALHAGNVHHELQQAPVKFSQRPVQFSSMRMARSPFLPPTGSMPIPLVTAMNCCGGLPLWLTTVSRCGCWAIRVRLNSGKILVSLHPDSNQHIAPHLA